MTNSPKQDKMANAIRFLAIDAIEKANSGHPGLPMGAADIATVLFGRFLSYDPKKPDWPNRDRFVLSAGHGSMLLYALLYLTGYEDVSLQQIKDFRQLGAKTAGHPEYGAAGGIETTTGPLGQGLANAVGMALGERLMNARFGDLINHYTYVLAGDGCLMEGISQEAIAIAGHFCLNKLILFWDDNGISIDGAVSLADKTDQAARFTACGWQVLRVDGHDQEAIAAAIEQARRADRPTMIACKTVIGFGAPNKAGTNAVHGSPLGAAEAAATRKALAWAEPPFTVPQEILDNWRLAGLSAAKARVEWDRKFAALDIDMRTEFERLMRGDLPARFTEVMSAYKRKLCEEAPNLATRQSSQQALEVINALVPEIIGGSADLTGSNNTRTAQMRAIVAGDFSGRYIHYGIREHAMGAVMNGLALYDGFIPYGGTFLCFSDYMRPAMRLASLMKLRVIYVMTHDSIGLGEDGPTHQPVEQLAALRAMPNHLVFRPADAVEVAECWELALQSRHTPSTLALTRQSVPALRKDYEEDNICALGAYELQTAGDEAKVTLFASGSEVALIVEARAILEQEGIPTRVVSVPCFELFDKQPQSYKRALIGDSPVKIAVEAAVRQGWGRFIGADGIFIGMKNFGASGGIEVLYKHFGITAAAVVAAARAALPMEGGD
ncbi:transketolase [Candidatus Tokpelaia sp.]|uniref:transketolase n=1 Tax=Candidatus Tokpelaia sp. TaxID=2233777 RepID=UPI0012391EEB|nr:transketolase [Candidatus Tokpelaia sp.]KAA6405447.1 transketolase [Candidatus Tokpelaia sp.]